MPGKVLEVKAVAGADVKKGDPMVVMEAMKMEHTLAAQADGTISELPWAAGDQVSEGAVIARFAES